MNKKNCLIHLILVFFICLLLPGCNGQSSDRKDPDNPFNSHDRYISMLSYCESDQGIYYIEWESELCRLYFIDKKSSKKTVLCQKINCRHDSAECPAVEVSPDLMGSVAYCDGFIYYIVQSFDSGEQNDVLKLYSMKEDGTEKKELHTFQYGRVYPNAAAFYKDRIILSVQTLNDFEDGSGSYTAEPSIILYDLKTGKETLILNGTENSGLYTVPAGADEDHLYLLQQPFNDSDIDGRCTYLQYDLKEQTMEPLYESRVKDSQIIADNTLYIQPDNEHRLVKYNLKTQKQEDVLDWDASVDKVWVIDRDLILLIKETRSEDSSKIQYVNWYDLKEQQYLFDEYSDYTTLEVMGKTEKGFLVWKEDELYFYTPADHHWEKIEEIS